MYMIIPQLDEQGLQARTNGQYGPVHIRVEAKKPTQSSKIVASPILNQRISRIKLK